jgi:hypothetical protein
VFPLNRLVHRPDLANAHVSDGVGYCTE